MKKELFAGLLMAVTLVASVTVSAARIAGPSAASSEFCWQSFCNEDVETIFSIEDSKKSVKVLVHLDQLPTINVSRVVPTGACAILNGCNDNQDVYIYSGQTIQCNVEGQHHDLTARSCDSNRVTGVIQLINI